MSRRPRAGTAGVPLTIRVTPDERDLVRRAAELSGTDMSNFSRPPVLKAAERAIERSKKR